MNINVDRFLKFFYLTLLYHKDSIVFKFPKQIVLATMMEIINYEEKKNAEQIIEWIIYP